MKGYKRRLPARGPDAWELVANLGRDRVTGKRRQRSRTFRGTERQADTALAQLVADATRSIEGPGTEAPLNHLVDAWLDMVKSDLSPTTLRGYRQVARNQIAPTIGLRPINEITTPELDTFYRRLMAGDPDVGVRARKPATVRQAHAIIRRAFRQAVRWGWVATNPAVEATPPRVRKSVHQLPSREQLGAIVKAAHEMDPELAALLRLAAATGARRGEMAGLHESRVDLVAGAVLIEHTVVIVGDDEVTGDGVIDLGNGLAQKDTKSHAARRVALDAGTVVALKRQLIRSKERALAGGIGRVADPFVFSSTVDGAMPVRPSEISERFRVLARRHAPGVRLHDLRHFVATELLAAGVPVNTVSARLGHRSAAMTLDVYGHAIAAADQGAADMLGGMLDA